MKKLLFAFLGLTLALPLPEAKAQMINAQTGTTYTVLNTDCDPGGRRVVTFNNAAGVAVTLPQAGLNGQFVAGCTLKVLNVGLGAVTITPATSTINGAATLAVNSGGSAEINNDSTNYWSSGGGGGSQGGASYNNFRNVIVNGSMAVQQRGTGERTGSTTTLPSSAYSADRWGCQANVTSGAAFCATLATGPTGFSGSQSIYRKTGALLQPVCMLHEVLATDSTTLAGQPVTLSFYAKALGGMIADNGGVINAYILTGTGADQGFQTMTASPAITPAWTNVSAALTKSFTLTTAYQRFSYTATLPGTETELGVAICFTPTASGSGTTDGFNFSGVQLEQNTIATPFEFRPYQTELQLAQYYYYQLNEGTAAQAIAECNNISVTLAACTIPLPVSMRVIPTVTTATGFAVNTTTAYSAINNCSAFVLNATSTTPKASTTAVPVTCTATTVPAAGTANTLWSNGGSGAMNASADF